MNKDILKTLNEIQADNLSARDLEEKEFLLLQELCSTEDLIGTRVIINALARSGTILATPVLCGLLKAADEETKRLLFSTINMIKARAKARGSFLPDIFFTEEHWRPEWRAGKTNFLSYVQFIAHAYIKCGHPESELNRIGQILAEEMNFDTSPYETFTDYIMCQSDWDFDTDFEIVQGRMEQEQLREDMENMGVSESDVSFITSSLMDLQYDYLIARLKLKGNLEYYRFVLEIAESLNQEKA